MGWRRQVRELIKSRGRVLVPKLAPLIHSVKYLGKGVPLKQVSALENLLRFTRFLDAHEIPYFLSGGTLLGAVRQGAFAGRPGDIDLGIFENYEQKLLRLQPQLAQTGFSRDAAYVHHPDKIVFTKWRTPHVDIMVYRPTTDSREKAAKIFRHINASGQAFDCNIDLVQNRRGKIFSFYFPIPDNSEQFIENQYGANWSTPDSPQPSLKHR